MLMAEFDLIGAAPDVAIPLDGRRVMIRCEQLDPAARRTGKHIHLKMAPEDAMRLLMQLRFAQQKYGWPDHPGEPDMVEVPADRQKN